MQTAAISAGLLTGQPGATSCVSASDTFQHSLDGKIVRDFIKQDLVGIYNPPGRVLPNPIYDRFDDEVIRHCVKQEAVNGTNVHPEKVLLNPLQDGLDAKLVRHCL